MSDLDLLHFEQLKAEVQEVFLESHTPSEEDISLWKGIDIVYFQEDLRKKVKGNISERSFYTYFKSSPTQKLPRIDMLNLLSSYAGYANWYDFKKNHLFANEILSEIEESDEEVFQNGVDELVLDNQQEQEKSINSKEIVDSVDEGENIVLQKSNTDLEKVVKNSVVLNNDNRVLKFTKSSYVWISATLILLLVLVGIIFSDLILTQKYSFKFIDADRNTSINDYLDVKIIKEGESPILHKVKPNDILTYTTKSKSLMMVISSPYYKTDTIVRNLENALTYPEYETIELKPDDYAIMLNYYSKKADEDVNKKRERLSRLISNEALIYQVFDNETYGVEILEKDRYITLMTTPTTSLKNLEIIGTQMKNGKIVMIKFRITNNEK
ncbi:hypothetical protein [Riemerella anatipestifer]|uniref:Uncharacterized protein n=1 Tax=Riemerella anatipestifer RA-CH-1 TaxID=1228997 RepID=J9R6W0_RIEAN|nr:hypothetical protein [Riemerella anatipestifer]AFR35522.1 hypothetical protein B739_0922 [Riemerella anatipestifer RA-CH-1]AIH02559.1 hypothetical protein M949_1391 [Riemerella anatipestifer CH3]MCO7331909.1 hypothetical protein [Riemerella anatipestifer]MCO7350796.1 hypothetical protein [Riemerella anatipestifer]MCU7583341.1 hypothetical protein [Riemerella anatipestifer]